ncbi:mycbp2, partial [Symbiodinium sp. KB8]
ARVSHPSLRALLDPLEALEKNVREKALMRLKYEGLDKHSDLQPGGRYFGRPADFAMDQFAYYQCFKCKVTIG